MLQFELAPPRAPHLPRAPPPHQPRAPNLPRAPYFSRPLVALEEADGSKLEHANEAEALFQQPSGHSGRARAVAAQKAAAIRAEAEELSAAASLTFDLLTTALTALAGARSKLDEHMESSEANAGGSPKGGSLTIALKEALRLCGISMQRYWNGTLVGPAASFYEYLSKSF